MNLIILLGAVLKLKEFVKNMCRDMCDVISGNENRD